KNAFEEATEATRGAAYAMLLLVGWGAAVLLAANLPLAERLGHALFDGQLYFTDRGHFFAALGALALAVPLLGRLSRPLLLSHFYPDFYRARGRSARRLHLSFDLVVAGVLALATTSVGVMAAFALVFIPPLAAAPWVRSWRASLLLGAVLGGVAHLLAFALALVLDQPFGPVLALLLVALGAGSALLAPGHARIAA
ncbi:MAG TPA: metal ABC transporter permease, partial [Azospira sp.]|nr:metal ABC transporter permease [Azospira sp.]